MEYDPREVSILVRDALLIKQEQERGQPETLPEELEREAVASLRTIQNLIDAMARQRRLWLANGMNLIVANPDAPVAGTFSRARWMEIEEAFNAFETWMVTPLPGAQVPPLVIVSRRGNPYEPPAEPEQPQETTIIEEPERAKEARKRIQK